MHCLSYVRSILVRKNFMERFTKIQFFCTSNSIVKKLGYFSHFDSKCIFVTSQEKSLSKSLSIVCDRAYTNYLISYVRSAKITACKMSSLPKCALIKNVSVQSHTHLTPLRAAVLFLPVVFFFLKKTEYSTISVGRRFKLSRVANSACTREILVFINYADSRPSQEKQTKQYKLKA